jgi:CheY-like chemotaxis protein
MIEQETPGRHPFVVLMADDDPDDIALVRDALSECDFKSDFRSVCDGYELLQYLHQRGPYARLGEAPVPELILMDLNMPLRNGTEVLAELKCTRHLRAIPIVIVTTSNAERDRSRTEELGADGFLTKPSTYAALLEMTRSLEGFCTGQGGRNGN